MKDYAGIANTSGSFPSVVAANESPAGAKNGTIFTKDGIDDIFGFGQALMAAANLTPDGVSESASASQRLLAVKRIAGHPGEVVAWAGVAPDPSAVDIRLLPCQGQRVDRNVYTELDDAVWVGASLNAGAPAYNRWTTATGGTTSVSGNYLQLPDYRGIFLRGLDVGGSRDVDGASSVVGDYQIDSLINHEHGLWGTGPTGYPYYAEYATINVTTGATALNYLTYTSSSGRTNLPPWVASGSTAGWLGAGAVPGGFVSNTNQLNTLSGSRGVTVPIRTENRPQNSAVIFCIRY